MANQTEELAVIRTDFVRIQKRVAALQVVDEETKHEAAESIALIKRMLQRAEQSRKEKVAPLNDELSRTNGRYKEFSEPAKALLESLNQKLITFNRQQEQEAEQLRQEQLRKEEEARKKHEAELRKAEKKGTPPPPPPPPPMPTEAPPSRSTATSFGTTSVQENWVWELVNLEAVPRMFMMLDEAKVTRLVKAGTRDIPGLKIYNKGKVVLR